MIERTARPMPHRVMTDDSPSLHLFGEAFRCRRPSVGAAVVRPDPPLEDGGLIGSVTRLVDSDGEITHRHVGPERLYALCI